MLKELETFHATKFLIGEILEAFNYPKLISGQATSRSELRRIHTGEAGVHGEVQRNPSRKGSFVRRTENSTAYEAGPKAGRLDGLRAPASGVGLRNEKPSCEKTLGN
jgi:hypothetical protein